MRTVSGRPKAPASPSTGEARQDAGACADPQSAIRTPGTRPRPVRSFQGRPHQRSKGSPMSATQSKSLEDTNKAVVENFMEVFSTGDIDAFQALMTDDCIWWVAGNMPGVSGSWD